MSHDQAYYAAEKKIEAARRSGATELHLRGMELTELPESLGHLTQLRALNLVDNQLTALPESLGHLTHLRSLDLRNNQLTALPEWLGRLMQLQSLNLASNPLTALPESLGHLTQLQSLNLAFNPLTALPESLGHLTQLQSLMLYDNQLTVLPESLGHLTQLQSLYLSGNPLTALPEWLGHLTQLRSLGLSYNRRLTALPEWLGHLTQLRSLSLAFNQLTALPEWLSHLTQLQSLDLGDNQLTALTEWLGYLTQVRELYLSRNQLTTLPESLGHLEHLKILALDRNPLNPELASAYKQGIEAVKAYLRAKAGAQIILNEAKLILVGEGEVGKTCLMDALLGKAWQEHPSTHGIEIQSFKANDPETQKEITLNGWDFGGQRVYRPTHQLFFSAPAIYLVVWKPREGPQQGLVKEWIQLVKRREPSAKIIVVATHGGPQQRQPDIDRQELWDTFGRDTVVEFFFVDSKPDKNGERKNIEELKRAVVRIAATLPEVGRSVPKSFQDVRLALQAKGVPYLPLEDVLDICRAQKMDDEIARLFIAISHRLGHLTHYENDPALRDIVILRPDWLAIAMSYVLDDELTREANHGIVSFARLQELWSDPKREPEFRYSPELHPLFLRLMERFDLSYKVALPGEVSDAIGFWQQSKSVLDRVFRRERKLDDLRYTSLIGQLVPDVRPVNDLARVWPETPLPGDLQQTQICRIVDAQSGQSANAEGLFYQLIVRLHKYSLGRVNYNDSVHWQRGLVLEDNYNGRALLEHLSNDVRITVRAPYPERFLTLLTEEVKYLVESFWEGLRCDVTVPCLNLTACAGLFEVRKLMENKKRNRPEQPCPICNEWYSIEQLLHNAPAAQPEALLMLLAEFAEVKREVVTARGQLLYQGEVMVGRFDRLDDRTRRILSRVDNAYDSLLRLLTDEAKEGPRLFSFAPVSRSLFQPQWTSAKFRLILWCEHSRLPVPLINGKDDQRGIYEIELTREWFKTVAPYLKFLIGTLSLVLPVASAGLKLTLDKNIYDALEKHLDFGKEVIDASLTASDKAVDWLGQNDTVTGLVPTDLRRAEGATLRELHALLKAQDPGFGGLVRVLNKRQEFLWVHPQFEKEY